MCILCLARRWSQNLITMLPWLTGPLLVFWGLSQFFPPGWRLEVTPARVACVAVLLLSLGWYEVIMPRLQEWRTKRTALLREQRKVDMKVEARWRKEAVRHCRNCRAAYKDQSPPGGKFMCVTCGHVSKRPLLGIPGQVGVEAGPVSGKGVWWAEVLELLSCLDMRIAWVRTSALYRLDVAMQPLVWLSEWMTGWRNYHEAAEESHHGCDSVQREDAGTLGRGERVKKKAEEKRLARMKKEEQEAIERQEREEITRLVEEQRRKTEQQRQQQAQAERELAAQRDRDERSTREFERRRKEREARERERERLLRASEVEACREKPKQGEKRTVEKIVKCIGAGTGTKAAPPMMHSSNRVGMAEPRSKAGGPPSGLRPGHLLLKTTPVAPPSSSSLALQAKASQALRARGGAGCSHSAKVSPVAAAVGSKPALPTGARVGALAEPMRENATWSKVLLAGLKQVRNGGGTAQGQPSPAAQTPAMESTAPTARHHVGLDWRPLPGGHAPSASAPTGQQTAAAGQRTWQCLFGQSSLFSPPVPANTFQATSPHSHSLHHPFIPHTTDMGSGNVTGMHLHLPSSPLSLSPHPVAPRPLSSSCTSSNTSSICSSPVFQGHTATFPPSLSPTADKLMPLPLEALSQSPHFQAAPSVKPWPTLWVPQQQLPPSSPAAKLAAADDVPPVSVREALETWSLEYNAHVGSTDAHNSLTTVSNDSLWSAPLNVLPPMFPIANGGSTATVTKTPTTHPWQAVESTLPSTYSPKGVVGDRKPKRGDTVPQPWQQSRSVLDKAFQLQLWGEEALQLEQPPPEFLDCITQELMTDPVITADGHSYERSAIERWLRQHDTSPMTGQVLPPPPGQNGQGVDKTLRPNHILRSQIIEYQERCQRVMRSMANNAAEWGVLGSSLWSGVKLCEFNNKSMHRSWVQTGRTDDLSTA